MGAIPGTLNGGTTTFSPAALPVGGAAIMTLGADGRQNTLPGVAGDVIYHNGTTWVRLPIDEDGKILTAISGVPAWQESPVSAESPLTLTAANITDVPLTLVLSAGHTANGFRIQDSGLANVLWCTAAGDFHAKGTITAESGEPSGTLKIDNSAGMFTLSMGGGAVARFTGVRADLASNLFFFSEATQIRQLSNKAAHLIELAAIGGALKIDSDATAGNTALQIRDVDSGALARVKRSADVDSGGKPLLVLDV